MRWQRRNHGSPNLSQKTRPNNNQQKKKRICKIVDFTVPADHRIKLKESEKKDKYLDLARELKKLWNMKGTIIPIAFGTVSKGLLKRQDDFLVSGRVEPSKLQYYWEQPEYWEESWRLKETCCHSNSRERPSVSTDVKNSKGINNNDYNKRLITTTRNNTNNTRKNRTTITRKQRWKEK